MTESQTWWNPVRARLEAGQPIFGVTITTPSAKRVLDQGVSGVIFPFAGTPEKAAGAAAARRHRNLEQGFRARQLLDPLGISGMGRHS